MMLNLDDRQVDLLNEALRRHLERLEHEIIHTDRREFKRALMSRSRELEDLLHHVSMRAAESAVYR